MLRSSFTRLVSHVQILCEHLGYGFTALFKIPETCPSASHAKQVLEGMQQNKTPEKNHIVCIVSKDVVQHFNKNAEL